ncbi:MAG TPA: DUF4907 domain-containing protein [Bacteroidales bacterium]|nr:DUF4907 domain-containing protein [Bacteroidales bacterium]
MTDHRKKALIIFALFAVITAVSFAVARRGQFYEVALFRSGNGWGYDILREEKVYIHQPFMPAVEGEAPFRDKEAARKTGRLVVRKIRKHQLPTISKEEIKSITGD